MKSLHMIGHPQKPGFLIIWMSFMCGTLSVLQTVLLHMETIVKGGARARTLSLFWMPKQSTSETWGLQASFNKTKDYSAYFSYDSCNCLDSCSVHVKASSYSVGTVLASCWDMPSMSSPILYRARMSHCLPTWPPELNGQECSLNH